MEETIDFVIKSLENLSVAIFKWPSDNPMQNDADKCYVLISNKQEEHINTENVQHKLKTVRSLYWHRLIGS